RSLRAEVLQLRDQVKYGDPFVILRHHGNGKVVAVMTTAGKEWNDWAGGSESSIFYQPFIWEMLNYLTSQSAGQLNDVNRFVGDTVRVAVDPEQYRQKGRELRLARFYHKWRKDEAAKPEKKEFEPLRGKEGLVDRAFDKHYEPGIYTTHLLFEDDPDEARPLAAWAHAFNVDTGKESKLARVSSDEFDKMWTEEEKQRKFNETLRIEGPEDTDESGRIQVNEKPWELSEMPWLFLLFLGILVAEQALAVHLSFHMRSEKGELPTVVVRPGRAAAGFGLWDGMPSRHGRRQDGNSIPRPEGCKKDRHMATQDSYAPRYRWILYLWPALLLIGLTALLAWRFWPKSEDRQATLNT